MSDSNESPFEASAATTVSEEKDKVLPAANRSVQEISGDVVIAAGSETQTALIHPKPETTGTLKDDTLGESGAPRIFGPQTMETAPNCCLKIVNCRTTCRHVPTESRTSASSTQRGSSQQSASDSLLPESLTEKVSPVLRLSTSCPDRNDERIKLLISTRLASENSSRLRAANRDYMPYDSIEMRRKRFAAGRRNGAMKAISDLEHILTEVSSLKSVCIPPRDNQQQENTPHSRKKWDAPNAFTANEILKNRIVPSAARNNESEVNDDVTKHRCLGQRKSLESFARRERKRWDTCSSPNSINIPTGNRKRSRSPFESRSLELQKQGSCSNDALNFESGRLTKLSNDCVAEVSAAITSLLEEFPSAEVESQSPKSYCATNDSPATKKADQRAGHSDDKPLPVFAQIQKIPKSEVARVRKPFRLFIRLREVQQRLQEISKAARHIIDMTEQLTEGFSLLNMDFTEQETERMHFSEPEMRFREEVQKEEFSATASGDSFSSDFPDLVPLPRSLSEVNLQQLDFSSDESLTQEKSNFDTFPQSFSYDHENPTIVEKCNCSKRKLGSELDHCCSFEGPEVIDNTKDLKKPENSTPASQKILTSSENSEATSAHCIASSEDSEKEGVATLLQRAGLKEALLKNDSGDYNSGENLVIIDDVVGKNDCFERCEASNGSQTHAYSYHTKTCAQDNERQQTAVGEGGDVPSFSSEESEELPLQTNSPPSTEHAKDKALENLNSNEEQQIPGREEVNDIHSKDFCNLLSKGSEACNDFVEDWFDLTPNSPTENKSGSSEYLVAHQHNFLTVSIADEEEVNKTDDGINASFPTLGTEMFESCQETLNDSPEQYKGQESCFSQNKSLIFDITETSFQFENNNETDRGTRQD